ncbi:MAG TPA: permease-like cell division protein FtsX [Kofleriaceae bacterium]|nr:permease-like cell division protein FtsX [Kofleriaceae bacterium]
MIPPSLASALRRTARIAVERPRAGLWTLLALTCALLAASVAAIAAASIERWARARPAPPARMVVYLGEGVSEARAEGLARELRGLRGVLGAQVVPAAESARRLTAALGAEPALLEGVDVAALPASVEVTLAPGVRDVIAMSPTVRALRGADGVADVVLDGVLDDVFDDAAAPAARGPGADPGQALGAARALAWSGAALLAGLALIVVLAAIRVRLDRGPRELAVMHLLGAGPGFVAGPTALAGALSGLLAASLAALGIVLGIALGVPRYGAALGPHLAVPGLAELAALLGAGALLGGIGGALAGASRAAR